MNDDVRLSDVFHFSGAPEIGLDGETDVFVLQLTVTGLPAGSYLGWLDPETNTWVSAVNGNFGGSTPNFVLGAYNPSTDFYLGYYGYDAATGSVWAVLNHNSEFSIIPEPGTVGLAVLGVLELALRKRRRTCGVASS